MSDKIAQLLKEMDAETRINQGFERSLYHLLKAHEKELPKLNDYFHKAFRQVDITESGHIDMAIYQALQESKVFWRCFERMQPEKETK